MSDNHRQYRTIRKALDRFYPHPPEGNQARHLNTLAALTHGIVRSKSTQLSAIAKYDPSPIKVESRIKKLSRFVDNEHIDLEIYFAPYAQVVLEGLAMRPLVLVIDGSQVGRDCAALMLSVVYRGRALPLGWLVRLGPKGHFSEALHLALLEQIQPLLPAGAQVVLVGDGEFDGVALQSRAESYGWQYVLRTAQNTCLRQGNIPFTCQQLSPRYGSYSFADALFTQQGYGPVRVIGWWGEGYDEPLYLVTNLDHVEQAFAYYRKRPLIETFFSDSKSRGFHLHKSHLDQPKRLARLMMGACLAYIWIVYLGYTAVQEGWLAYLHRTDRCDLSLFQLGLRFLDHLLNEDLPIPISFRLEVGEEEELKMVA